ncbi:MAG: HD domain-containing phosphohydrolase [Myxococcota bacterium]|nr:HD domain-containing phosphohydrolase [Myxococcota bacterium]
MMPPTSSFAGAVKETVEQLGLPLVPVDAATPADLAERIVVVDLTKAHSTRSLGRRFIAISDDMSLDCFEVIRPSDVSTRLERSLSNLVEMERLRAQVEHEQSTVRLLNEIGLALSAITDREELLEAILEHSRTVLSADAGTIYLTEGQELLFSAAQNDTVRFTGKIEQQRLKVDDGSLAGFVAARGSVLNIDDVYQIPEQMPYRPNFSFDEASGYRTRSMLLVPMTDHDSQVLGVLALVNRKPVAGRPLADFSHCMPFTERQARLAQSIASQAAVALENYQLFENIRKLFDSFITAAVSVIEARDPSTAGHSQRVADLTVELAKSCEQSAGAFHGLRFSTQEMEELRYASLLHDFGKVSVREEVLLKANKLYPWEMERIEWRFKVAGLQAELEWLNRGKEGCFEQDALKRDLEAIRRMNSAGHRFVEDDLILMREIAARWLLSTDEPVLSHNDMRRLCIPRGSLDEDERREIERHVEHTYQFLKCIPWTDNLSKVPDLAHAHHERLDGTGYPLGLSEPEIPLGAKLMSVTDIFDALTAGDRPYKASMPVERAVSILRAEAESNHLLSDAVEVFVEAKLWTTIGLQTSNV